MTILAVFYIVSLCVLVGAILGTPDHTYRGTAAAINVLTLFAAGLALAIHALGS